MGAAYDNYKFTEDWNSGEPDPNESFYSGPTNQQITDKLTSLEQDIAWNIDRLANLILSDEDRQQTEDYIMEMRQERESLKRCFNV